MEATFKTEAEKKNQTEAENFNHTIVLSTIVTMV